MTQFSRLLSNEFLVPYRGARGHVTAEGYPHSLSTPVPSAGCTFPTNAATTATNAKRLERKLKRNAIPDRCLRANISTDRRYFLICKRNGEGKGAKDGRERTNEKVAGGTGIRIHCPKTPVEAETRSARHAIRTNNHFTISLSSPSVAVHRQRVVFILDIALTTEERDAMVQEQEQGTRALGIIQQTKGRARAANETLLRGPRLQSGAPFQLPLLPSLASLAVRGPGT